MRPLRDRVFVQPHQPPTTTESGIVIPDTAWRPSFVGTVLAVGPDVTDLKAGDLAVFGLNNGLEIAGSNRLVLRESEVLCVLER